MAVEGTPAFNAVAVLEVAPIKFTGDVELVAKAAYVNTKTGNTYGSVTCRRWSKETLDKLQELRAAMERDVAAMVFEQGTIAHARPQGGIRLTDSEPVGIGEHLSTQTDAPSV